MKSKSCDRNPNRLSQKQPGKQTAALYRVLSLIGTGITILGVAGCSNPSTVSSEQQTGDMITVKNIFYANKLVGFNQLKL